MNSKQRKAHKYIWLLIALVVPVLMVFAIKDLDLLSSKSNASPNHIISKEKPLSVFENDLVKTAVFDNRLELILKSTLKNSSSVIYEMDKKGNKSSVIGQLTTAGIYNFKINNRPKGIIISDDLKNITITKFSFKWD